jgi:hypothetical protein
MSGSQGSSFQPQQQWQPPNQGMLKPAFGGQTQDMGNGLSMRQMGPSMLPPNRMNTPAFNPMRTDPTGQRPPGHYGVDSFPPRPGAPGSIRPPMIQDGLMMPNQTGPSMVQPWMQPKAWTPPAPPGQPQMPPQQPPGMPPPQQPQQPQQPQLPPGIPAHIASQIKMGPEGPTYLGQRVKFDGTQMRFDDTPFVPGQQYGQFGAPGAGGFGLDQSSGVNMITGGANGPQMYNAEGLVQGGQAPQNFVNYLNSYRR